MKRVELRPIKDFALGIYDGPHATPKESSEGAVFLGIKNITEGGRLDLAEIRHVSEQELPIWTRRVTPQAGDVVFTYEATLHHYAIIPEGFHGCLGRRVALVRPDTGKADSRFMLYYFLSEQWRRVVQGFVKTGATVDRIPLEQFPDFPVSFPKLEVQKQIAEVLSAYDDLIDNNRRRIALLEESARLLYQEWFVRLRFPGHEHTRIINGIPEGWERKPLAEYTNFLKRGIAPFYENDAAGLVINQKCIRDGRLNLNLARHQSREFSPERQLQVGDVLVNSTGEGTLGRVAPVNSPVDNCTVDTHVTIVRPKPGIPIHYFGMVVMAWEPLFSTMGRGATNQTELSPRQIGESPILMPSKTLVEEFESFAAPILQQVTNLVSQNDKLRAARDLLLPRLMNGEIAV